MLNFMGVKKLKTTTLFVVFCGDGDGNHFECEFSPAKRGSDLWGERYDNYQTKKEEVGRVFGK